MTAIGAFTRRLITCPACRNPINGIHYVEIGGEPGDAVRISGLVVNHNCAPMQPVPATKAAPAVKWPTPQAKTTP